MLSSALLFILIPAVLSVVLFQPTLNTLIKKYGHSIVSTCVVMLGWSYFFFAILCFGWPDQITKQYPMSQGEMLLLIFYYLVLWCCYVRLSQWIDRQEKISELTRTSLRKVRERPRKVENTK